MTLTRTHTDTPRHRWLQPLRHITLPLACALLGSLAQAQDLQPDADSTITYPAAYFSQFGPVSVNDMLSRIPGIGLALENTEQVLGDGNNRGLGGSAQILVNGKRLAGKANDARNQLNRIAADKVDYIEIVRGTSGDLDVRNVGQLVNIVLLESLSSISYSGEVEMTRYDDGKTEPGGSLSVNGQRGILNYLFSADIRSGYELQHYAELSQHPDLRINETRTYERYTDQTSYTLNSNLVFDLAERDRLAFNLLYGDSDPSRRLLRVITDYNGAMPLASYERELLPSQQDNWEIGGDYQHGFENGNNFKILFITNERNNGTVRERYAFPVLGETEEKNLFLDTDSRYRERIVRTSFTLGLANEQSLELGLEGAQTIQDSALRLGVLRPGVPSSDYGGLVPVAVPNAISTVEELRVEGFAVHNWQINPRMSLESSVVIENSEIEQSGDVHNTRDFSFAKPKFDFRFNLNRSLQLRMVAENVVSQLSFADFSANSNNRDEDQDTLAGNPELEPEESWRYTVNLDYRLPRDGGVLSSRLFYFDMDNVIDRIDISPSPVNLQSTNGNVGDGTVLGLSLDASLRLQFLNLPQAVFTSGVLVQRSSIFDPMIGFKRRIVPYDRGYFRFGLRHDMPAYNFNYGFNYRDGIDGNRPFWDINNVLFIGSASNLSVFMEKVGWGGLTYRGEYNNALDHESCRKRLRYNGYLRDGNLSEIERFCTTTGPQLVFKIRGTF